MNYYLILLICISGYLIGSIPFSYLVAKWTKGIDLRYFGDGNVGASNVERVAGRKAGTAAFLLDCLKGIFPVFFTIWILKLPEWSGVLAGLSAIGGHNWPVFLGFRGGKGMSTTIGVVGTLVPIESAILLIPLFFLYRFLKHGIFSVMILGPLLPVLCWLRGRSAGIIWGTIFILLFVYLNGLKNVRKAWREIRNK